MVEHADNQAFTTLSYNGTEVSMWPDGAKHPVDWHGPASNDGCITDGFMHTTNQSDAQGTAFAIAYESDLSKISIEDLVVFSVLEHTPWHRLAKYKVPAGLPKCPPGGCTCAHMWVPRGCGEPNMYMQGFKCQVTGKVGTKKLAQAQPLIWCAGNPNKCRKGAKQMVVFNQLEGNNVADLPDGETPVYNLVTGFKPGAQTDIFVPKAQVTNGLRSFKKARSAAEE